MDASALRQPLRGGVLSAQLGLTTWEGAPTMIKNQRRDAARIIRRSK